MEEWRIGGILKNEKFAFYFFSDSPEIRVGGSVNQEIKKLWPNVYIVLRNKSV
jgi:hypothetical protein